MNRSGGKAASASDGSGPRLAAVPAARDAPDPDEIDWTLDDLVATVDDLVRDLDEVDSDSREAVPRPRAAPERVHSKAFTVAVVLVLIVFELLVLAWLFSNV